jgi:alkylhydroperoxidase/carboxymuconolactone decarboxylase family protein YurZ
MTTDTDTDAAALREAWAEVHGPLNAAAEELLRQNPSYFGRVLDFTAHAWRRGPLEPKIKALILLAVDSAASHLNGPGAADDVRRALALGATPAEVLETLELTSTMGIHAANTGVPILLEELAAAGQPVDMGLPLTERQEEIKAEFTAKRGYWNEFWDGFLRLDPEFFATYTAMSSHSWEHGTLQPKVKEFMYCAFDCSATHMFAPGLRQHVANAIRYGATAAELMEVFELASGIGVESFALALPALAERLGERARFVALDVTSEADWAAAVAAAEDDGWGAGAVTILIKNDGIRVNSLHPGMIRTAMTEGAPEEQMAAKYPLRRIGTPEEVVRTMLFIVCDATYASGDAFPVDGGILAGIAMGE